ncbi:hypothetical protein Tco_0955689 [Tanacetum coccineum]|uniref:Uncharacterized protein n=1 Tax=Tanacetum coccineum TaxID=301880 RepID=A0ABQ5E817_9ASTR
MNPLSESSCNCSDNSFISDGAIDSWLSYGAAPEFKSDWNSTVRAEVDLASTPAIASKVPYFVALVAPPGARAIMVKMALGAFGKRSPILLLFACPHIVNLGNIRPHEGLLLVTMVVSE